MRWYDFPGEPSHRMCRMCMHTHTFRSPLRTFLDAVGARPDETEEERKARQRTRDFLS